MSERTTPWVRATWSTGNGGACVECRRHHDMIEVRDSKDPDGPSLRFTPREWAAFLDGATKGEFTHLI